jgi:tetratricopeptide (TPR) repeat protein
MVTGGEMLRVALGACLGLFVLGIGVGQEPGRGAGSAVESEIVREYQQALEQVQRGDFNGAVARLESITARAPRFYRAYNLLGVCDGRLGNHLLARRAFLEALKINPKFDEAPVNLGANYATQGRIPEGIAEFQKAIELNPKSVSAYFNLGYTELRQGRAVKASAPLKKAHELSPRDSVVLPTLATALLKAGRSEEALRYAQEAHQAKPPDSELLSNLGFAFLGTQQCEPAQKYLRAAARADPTLGERLWKLSEKTFDEQKYEEALCLLAVVKEFVPDSAAFHSLAGACHYQLQNPQQAAEEVQKAIHLDPQNEEYYIQLAQIFVDYNTPDAAILLLEPALNLFPNSPRVRYALGIACMKGVQAKKAEQYLTESLQMKPHDTPTLRALAELYEGERKSDELMRVAKTLVELPNLKHEGFYYQAAALHNLYRDQPQYFAQIDDLLRKSIALEPKFTPSHFLLGKFLLERGAYSEAVRALQQAIALDPESEGAYYNLALAYGKLGENQKQAETWAKFQSLSQQKKKSPEKKLYYEVIKDQAGEKK